jgi:fumarate reductase subunit C
MTTEPYYARLYKARVSLLWWLRRRSYTAFILRELSSVFVAWFVVYLLLLVRAVSRGATAYADFLDWSTSPWLVGLNAITLVFVLYHAVTFINLTPQAMVVRLRGRRVPALGVTAPMYVAWLAVSAFLAWLVIG